MGRYLVYNPVQTHDLRIIFLRKKCFPPLRLGQLRFIVR